MIQTSMKKEEKETFDYLNQTSYLLRLSLNRLNFDIHAIEVNSCTIWHVTYRDTVIGTITFRTNEHDYTFCNVRLYKYLKLKNIEKFSDFVMSEYFDYDENGKPIKFNVDKFDKYFNAIVEVFPHEELVQEEDKHVININDSISRLTEYCDEFDEKFSKNTHVLDIKNLLNENERLNENLSKQKEIFENI